MITTPYISRILGAEGIGQYSFQRSIAAYFVLFGMLGFNNYGNRTIAACRDNIELRRTTFFEIYFLQLLTTGLASALYAFWCYFFSNDVLSWIFLVYVLSASLDINWFFNGIEKFKLTVTRSMIVRIVSTLIVFGLVKEKNDIPLYAGIIITSTVASNILLWPFLRKNGVFYTKVAWARMRKHLKPVLILFLPTIAVSVYKLMDKIMLGFLAPISEVGFYENSEKFIQVPNGFVVALGAVMLPRISNLTANNEKDPISRYYYRSVWITMLAMTPISLGIIAVADELVPLFFGQGYQKCIEILKILMPSCIIVGISTIVRTQCLLPNKRDKQYVLAVCFGAMVNIILNLIFIRLLGSIGAAIGTLFAEFAVCCVQLLSCRRDISIRTTIEISLPFVIVGYIMYFSITNIHFELSSFWDLTTRILIGGLMYVVMAIPVAYHQHKKILN